MQSVPNSSAIRRTSILRSLLFERFRYRLLLLVVAAIAAVMGILAPYSQKHFVDSLLGGEAGARRWIWAAFGLTLGTQMLTQLAIYIAQREGVLAQKGLGDRAYARVLEGPGGLIGRRPAGEAVSIFAVDVSTATALISESMMMAMLMIFPLLAAPIALHALYGIPWAAAVVAIACLGLFNLVLAIRQARYFQYYKEMSAERTGLVTEWVQNIRTLRILGWVSAVERRIFAVRARETKNRKAMVTNGQVMNAMATSSTFGLNILAIVLLIRLRRESGGGAPSAGEMLSLLWIMGVFLARPLRQFPWVLVNGMDALSSIRRLERAFAIPIAEPKIAGSRIADASPSRPTALEARGLELRTEGGERLLGPIDLTLREGELVAVVGEVGSGKSLLLQSLLGATNATFASYPIDRLRDRIAYVPQESFTMSASLRENVVFSYLRAGAGRKPAEPTPDLDSAVGESLRLAQFDPRVERMADGLDTELGERGVNLSGGQRQRVALARAHFSARPIVFLDDCLSAVDVDTERRLVAMLLCGAWSKQARLLVTHRMSVLPLCDRVLFMENGRVSREGTYAELLETCREFRDFVRKEVTVEENTGTLMRPTPEALASVPAAPVGDPAPDSEEAPRG